METQQWVSWVKFCLDFMFAMTSFDFSFEANKTLFARDEILMKTPFVDCERKVDALTAELGASQKEVQSRLHLCALCG